MKNKNPVGNHLHFKDSSASCESQPSVSTSEELEMCRLLKNMQVIIGIQMIQGSGQYSLGSSDRGGIVREGAPKVDQVTVEQYIDVQN